MNLLFMCVANSARSQMAEGLAQSIFPDAEVRSAGSHPGKVNPLAVAALEEVGIDISKNYSKSVDNLAPKFIVALDYVITLCAEEVCPVLITQWAKKLHWPLLDPAGHSNITADEQLQRFRDARDKIKEKLLAFKKELGVGN